MAEVSICKTRSPLSEATHRINASYAPAEDNLQKPRQDHAPNHVNHNGLNANGNHGDPDSRVAAPLASNPPVSAVLPPPQESDEAKRLSQASYDSTSSGRSRKNYKTISLVHRSQYSRSLLPGIFNYKCTVITEFKNAPLKFSATGTLF